MDSFRYGLDVWSIQSKASSVTNSLLKRKRDESVFQQFVSKKRKIVRTVVVEVRR